MDQLERLAEAAGIEPEFYDIFGGHHVVPPETKIAILNALGLPTGSAEECAASLTALEQRPWRRLCEPVAVLAAEQPSAAVTITVPEDRAGLSVEWQLVREDGSAAEGRCEAAALTQFQSLSQAALGHPRCRVSLPIGETPPQGYHRLTLTLSGGAGRVPPELARGACTVIVAPDVCWRPEDIAADDRFWGVSCQLYALRSQESQGIGNFTTLGGLAEEVGRLGGDSVGINPLHALFPANPSAISPYSPSSRLFLNVLYIDPAAVPDYDESPEVQAFVADPERRRQLGALQACDLVDYTAVADLLFPLLRLLHKGFRDRHLSQGTGRGEAFRAFVADGGRRLHDFATFHALQAHFADGSHASLNWQNWPKGYHRPDSPDVAAFVGQNAETVEFHIYLQWLADEQLRAAADRGRAGGLRVGLYRDLAIGVGTDSASAWSNPDAFARGVSVGAPPDKLNHVGQNWGLIPFHPLAMREQAFDPYIAALQANMRHAGALRIDHVMGLQHLYWVPPGLPASQGAYVHYPIDDLVRIMALESRRNRCLVIGEDLGTVPDGFRPRMAAAGVLSYRVFQFERVGDGLFRRASDYPAAALVTAGTHDLPTLAGFWTKRDIAWRQQLDLYPSAAMRDEDAAGREADRRRLVDALADAGLWPKPNGTWSTDAVTDVRALLLAVHRYLARAPSRLMMVQIEDAVAQAEQQNLPGTVSEHPNWQRRLGDAVAALLADPHVKAVLQAVAEERVRSVG